MFSTRNIHPGKVYFLKLISVKSTSSNSSNLHTGKIRVRKYQTNYSFIKNLDNLKQINLISLHTMTPPPSNNDNIAVLNQLGLLNINHVKIKHPEHVNSVVKEMVENGFDKLQIIADYDNTITRFHYNGNRMPSSFGIIDNSPLMPVTFREETCKLLEKYYPIEIDPKLSEEEKIPLMLEWYGGVMKLLVNCNIKKDYIQKMVKSSNVRLREGTEKMMLSLSEQKVPVLVFSAGMGDILEESLRLFSVYTDNVKVVSNFFKFDEEDKLIGFKGDLIHMYNKNENAIHKSDYFGDIRNRNNVILMGDSLGDIKMSHGIPQPNNILKIGFLNDKIEERLESYMDAYDIVLLDDQTMDVAMAVIQLIAEGLE